MDQSIDYKQLVSVCGDAIVVADPSGAIVLWNAAAERIFGFTETEAVGQTLDLITPERYRSRHWKGYHNTMETGVTRYGTTLLRVPATHKDGSTLSIAFTVSLLKQEDGSVGHIVAVVRDETARWKEERDLKMKLKELQESAT